MQKRETLMRFLTQRDVADRNKHVSDSEDFATDFSEDSQPKQQMPKRG